MFDKVNDGTPEEARDAFVDAAKITRSEMLSANSIFNIMNDNAYYNQQVLFNTDGHFDLKLSGESLRKYYQDYRTNPEYLQANPFDKISWEDLGKNNPDTECRFGFVLVYRTNVGNYVCTTVYTAEMWIKHKMGTITTPGFSESTSLNVEKLQEDRIIKKISRLNSKVNLMQEHYEKKMSDTIGDYELLFVKTDEKMKQEEKRILQKHNGLDSERLVLSNEITNMRETYSELKDDMNDERSRLLELLEKQYLEDLDDFTKNYAHDSEMTLIWNSEIPVFEINSQG